MSHVLVELGFKVHRGLAAERALEPRPVVKDFDPLEDGRYAGESGSKLLAAKWKSSGTTLISHDQRSVIPQR
jgi:hypothetical protein